ncbi:MAG: triose-phosphate isomerase [bacterium]
MKKRRMVIGGNWKMYKTPSEAISAAKALKVKLINVQEVDVVICPAFPALVPVGNFLKETRLKLGAQNLHWQDKGAFTGEVSAAMLKDAGCEYVIIGHSERRHVFGESDTDINKKVLKALASGLIPIFCVGEKIEERRQGLTEQIVETQMRNGLKEVQLTHADELVVAYEPVWAIGTGENATPQQAEEVHVFIRRLLEDLFGAEIGNGLRIQYGGSVKPANARELLQQENIDGALVGGASLDASSFTEIIKGAEEISI